MNKCQNNRTNLKLRELYKEYTVDYLKVCQEHEFERINEFGIIDVGSYDAENGILFIAKETNGWDYSKGETYRSWVEEMVKTKTITGEKATKHPQFWYNLGRWAKFILNSKLNIADLAREKDISPLKYVAITNLNKAEGESTSGNKFWQLIEKDVVLDLLTEEIIEIKPKLIVLCGIKKKYIKRDIENLYDELKIIEMPHPSARNISKFHMLVKLEKELERAGWIGK